MNPYKLIALIMLIGLAIGADYTTRFIVSNPSWLGVEMPTGGAEYWVIFVPIWCMISSAFCLIVGGIAKIIVWLAE